MAGYYNSLYNMYSTGNPVMDTIPSTFGTATQILQVNSAGDGLEWAPGGGGGGGSSSYSTLYIQDGTTGYLTTDGTKFSLSGLDLRITNQETNGGISLRDSTISRIGFSSTQTSLYSPNAQQSLHLDDTFVRMPTALFSIFDPTSAYGPFSFYVDSSNDAYITNTYVADKNIYLNTSGAGKIVVAGTFKNGVSQNQDLTNLNAVLVHNHATDLPVISGGIWNLLIGSSHSAATTISGSSNITIGRGAGNALSSGSENVLIGTSAGQNVATTSGNVLIGRSSSLNVTGTGNTNIGYSTTSSLTSGNYNVALGYDAGDGSGASTILSNNCITIGKGSGFSGDTTYTNAVALGTGALIVNSNQCVIGNSSLTSIVGGGSGVCDIGTSSLPFKDCRFNGIMYNSNSTATTSNTTGALIVTGGIASGDGMYCTGTFYNKNSINTDLTNFNQVIGHNTATLPTFSGGGAQYNCLIGSSNAGTITGNGNFSMGRFGLGVTSGNRNTSIGILCLTSITTTNDTCGLGYNAGNLTTVGNGCFFGASSGRYLTSGTNNTILGYSGALFTSGNTAQTSNTLTCIGASTTLTDGTAWANSIALGYQAAVTASNQCKIGNASVTSLVPGGDNVMDLGSSSLQFKDGRFGGIIYNKNSINTDLTNFNQALGHNSATLPTFSGGSNNLLLCTKNTSTVTGSLNCAVGALIGLTSGTNNVAVGSSCLPSLTTQSYNTAIGRLSGNLNTSDNNCFFGYNCGKNLTTGGNNCIIGYDAATFTTADTAKTSSNLTCIGTSTALTDGTAYDRSIAIGYGATITATKQIVIGDATLEATVVSASVINTVTNKLKIRIGGTDYYVLLSTSGA